TNTTPEPEAPNPEAEGAAKRAVPVQPRPVEPVENVDEPTGASAEVAETVAVQDAGASAPSAAPPPSPPLPPAERALTWRVTWVVVLGFVLSWSFLIAGAVILENLGRDRVSLFVAHRVQSMLSLDQQHPISVDIGGAPLVLQLWGQ